MHTDPCGHHDEIESADYAGWTPSTEPASESLPSGYITAETMQWAATAYDVDDIEEELPSLLSRVTKGYWIQWAYYVFVSLFFALICNGLYGIPLYQVVDVNLALFLTWVAVLATLLAVGLIFELAKGDFTNAFEALLYIALLAFLPFGAITGYMIYGWLGGGQITNASFVYDGFIGIFTKTYQYLSLVNGDVLGAIQVEETAKGIVKSVNTDLLLQWTQIAAGSLAAADVLVRWIRGRSPTRTRR